MNGFFYAHTPTMNYTITTTVKKQLADTITPVSIYLKLRDHFPNSILLESSDHHGNENSFSFICCKPFAGIKLENEKLLLSYPDGMQEEQDIKENVPVAEEIEAFMKRFSVKGQQNGVSG